MKRIVLPALLMANLTACMEQYSLKSPYAPEKPKITFSFTYETLTLINDTQRNACVRYDKSSHFLQKDKSFKVNTKKDSSSCVEIRIIMGRIVYSGILTPPNKNNKFETGQLHISSLEMGTPRKKGLRKYTDPENKKVIKLQEIDLEETEN